MSKFNRTAKRSAVLAAASVASVQTIDTLTAAERARYDKENPGSGFYPGVPAWQRVLTVPSLTARNMRAMAHADSDDDTRLREIAAGLGKRENGAWVCDPNGDISGVLADLMKLRRSESTRLGRISRIVEEWRDAR